jgi:hypothetical protein
MCEKCDQIEITIRRYLWFIAQGLDRITVERINELIRELRQRKESMHCYGRRQEAPPLRPLTISVWPFGSAFGGCGAAAFGWFGIEPGGRK